MIVRISSIAVPMNTRTIEEMELTSYQHDQDESVSQWWGQKNITAGEELLDDGWRVNWTNSGKDRELLNMEPTISR